MGNIVIFQIIVSALLWIATAILLFGQGALLGFGMSFMPTKDAESAEDQKLQCRYIGLRLLLPLSIFFTTLTVGEILGMPWFEELSANAWLGVGIFVAIFAYIFFIVTRVNSGKYKK